MDKPEQNSQTVPFSEKSKNMIGSFQRETDVLYLLNVFPEELWRLILANVQDANDYFRLCATSPHFKNLLSAQRVPVLLTAVVQILLRRRECWKWWPNHWNPELADKDPRVHLWHFAQCRQVSRDWRTGIERALQNLPYHQQFSKEHAKLDGQFYSQVFQYYSTRFHGINNMKAFEWWFNDSHLVTGANPFTTRALEIQIPFGKSELPEFINKLLDVLRKCGTHVWYLTIIGDLGSNYWPTAKQFAYFLKDVLEQVTNIIALRYYILNPFRFCEKLDCQFPPLKKLLFFYQVELPYGIVEAHLKSAKPEQISVTFYKETSLANEKTLKSFCELSAPLSKLRLELFDDKVYWDGIFSKLETFFGQSLTTLYISLPRTGLFVKSKELRLSSLKVLHLELEEPVPLDFLLGARKSLENLSIAMKSRMTHDELVCVRAKERKLKIYQAAQSSRLDTSNIWEMFPNLKEFAIVAIQKNCYSGMVSTRNEWNRLQSKSKSN